jgi:hypothetical protein
MNERFESANLRLVRRNLWALGFAGAPVLLASLGLHFIDLPTNNAILLLLVAASNAWLLALALWKWDLWPSIERVAVIADRAGLHVGARFLPCSAIREGCVVPASHDRSPHVVIQPLRGASIKLAIADLADGHALLHALGLDISQSVTVFRALPPMVLKRPYLSLMVWFVFMMSGQALFRNVLSGGGPLLGRVLPLVVPLVLCAFFMAPMRIAVGADGVELRWFWQRRLIRYRELLRAMTYKETKGIYKTSGIELTLSSGKAIRLAFSDPRKIQAGAQLVSERIQAAMDRHPAGEGESVEALLRRGSGEIPAWIRRLRSLGAGANAGMRTAPVPRDRLFDIVEDASMDPAARAAAAVALGPELDVHGRARLRAAGAATVAPRLRIAIEAAALGANEDAAIEAALAELDAEESKSRRME